MNRTHRTSTATVLASIIAFLLPSTGGAAQAASEEAAIPAKGFAVYEAHGNFKPYQFSRHAVGEHDIQIEILYAGICHSDLHHVFADWGKEEYPMVPGHEIVGRVTAVGENVTRFKVGDYAGIGCMVGSCRQCDACESDLEQYCREGAIMTYHGIDRYNGDEHTQGGYSDTYVVAEDFAIQVPASADISKVAPLMCAGITSYSPIKQAGVKIGDKVGVAGFGGLGHMGVKYAVSLGAEVTVFDITDEKREDAQRMGAAYVNVNKPDELKNLDNTFDFILSTIPAKYEPSMYMKMLKLDGQLGIVGLPAFRNMPTLTVAELIFQGRRKVFGSQIGGIKETQEMLDYSVSHGIYPEVEVIKAEGAEIDKAYENVLGGKVKFRYVIDMKTMK